jgi:hypothetical protein
MGPSNTAWIHEPASKPQRLLMRVDVKRVSGQLGTFYAHYASTFDAMDSAMDRFGDLDRVEARVVASEQLGAELPHCFAAGAAVTAND